MEAAHRKTQGMMLNNDDIQVMVEKWQKWQGAFSDYVLKPCCIHIILEDRVKCLNVWSSSVEEPVNKKLVKQTLVVGASASSSGTPAAEHIGDWTMAELEGGVTDVSRQSVAMDKELDRIAQEKLDLVRRMQALSLPESALEARASEIPELYAELASLLPAGVRRGMLK